MGRKAAALALLLALALLICGPGAGVAADGNAIKLSDVSVSVLDASGSAASTQAVAGPRGGVQAVLDHTRTVKVTFRASLTGSSDDFRPQQAFLRLTSRNSGGSAAYFAAVRAKDGTLYATAKSADVQKQVGLISGPYDAALLVGDTRSAEPQEWGLGEVQILHPPTDDGSQPAAAPYRALDALFQPRPEIRHMHRQAERRAPALVSLAFTLVAAAPTALYVLLALRAGANLKAFPTSGPALLTAAGFHGGLLAVLCLYLLFWLRLNLMQTLPILAALTAVTAAFGSSNMRQLAAADQRAKQE